MKKSIGITLLLVLSSIFCASSFAVTSDTATNNKFTILNKDADFSFIILSFTRPNETTKHTVILKYNAMKTIELSGPNILNKGDSMLLEMKIYHDKIIIPAFCGYTADQDNLKNLVLVLSSSGEMHVGPVCSYMSLLNQ